MVEKITKRLVRPNVLVNSAHLWLLPGLRAGKTVDTLI
jgi:hypothetical protein